MLYIQLYLFHLRNIMLVKEASCGIWMPGLKTFFGEGTNMVGGLVDCGHKAVNINRISQWRKVCWH
jgi:hypothetical protein